MTPFYVMTGSPQVLRLGWVLIHSLWQFTAIALLLAMFLAFSRRRSASLSYAACCAAMVLTIMLSGATFLLTPTESTPEVAAFSGEIVPDREISPDQNVLPVDRLEAVLPNENQRPLDISNSGQTLPSIESAASSPVERHSITEQAKALIQWLTASPSAWLPWVVLVWLTGVACFSLWNLIGWWTVQRLKVRATSPVSSPIQNAAAAMARRLGLKRSVRLLQSALVASPQVIGALKPLILFPASLISQLPPDQMESLLAHELAHILRQDYLINLLQCAVETLFFYHPALWWISAQTREQREYCCDDLAISVVGNRTVYVQALAAVAGARAYALAPASSGGKLIARLRRLLDSPPPDKISHPSRWITGMAALVICVAAATLLAMRSDPAHAGATTEADAEPAQDFNPVLEAKAILAVQKAGGTVRRDAKEPGNPVVEVFFGPTQTVFVPPVTDTIFKQLKAFNSLKTLAMLRAEGITDAGMQDLKELKSLEVLRLSGTQVGDEGLKAISELTNLKVLNIQRMKATETGIKNLRNLTGLQRLVLEGDQATEASLTALSGLENLRSLELAEPKGAADGLKSLARFKNLTQLQLTGPQVTDAVMKSVSKLEQLENLVIAEADLTNDGLKELKPLKNLHSLAISHTLVTDDGLKELKNFPNLHTLNLPRSAFTDKGIQDLKDLKGLRILVLNETNVTEAGIKSLQKSLPNCEIDWRNGQANANRGNGELPLASERQDALIRAIEKRVGVAVVGNQIMGRNIVSNVRIRGYQCDDQLLESVKEFRSLLGLVLAQTSITDSGLENLKGMTSLVMLDLQSTRVSDKGLEHLKQLRKLSQLNLGNTRVTKEGIRQLQKALPQCHIIGPGPALADAKPPAKDPGKQQAVLQNIQAHGGRLARDPKESGNPVVGVSFAQRASPTDAVVRELAIFPHLQRLHLNAPEVTDEGLTQLQRLPDLKSLSLVGTAVSDKGLAVIQSLKNLQELDLESAFITDAGLRNLSGLGNLKSLTLGGKGITDASMKELGDLSKLERLALRYTRVTDKGIGELRKLENLKTLSLGGTLVTGKGIEQLKGLKNLETLDLTLSDIADADLIALKDLTSLRTLILESTRVTDAGLKGLGNLKSLQTLNLAQTRITGAGLDELKELPILLDLDLRGNALDPDTLTRLQEIKSLRSLDLICTQLTDHRLVSLEKFSHLQQLKLGGPNGLAKLELQNLISKEGYQKLRKALPQCQIMGRAAEEDVPAAPPPGPRGARGLRGAMPAPSRVIPPEKEKAAVQVIEKLNGQFRRDANNQIVQVDLRGSQVKDADLKAIKELANLQTLLLGNTEITDAGLAELKGLKSLRLLGLVGTRVTGEGIKGIRAALPDCQVASGLGG